MHMHISTAIYFHRLFLWLLPPIHTVPENNKCPVETNLPTLFGRVCVNIQEGNYHIYIYTYIPIIYTHTY